MYFQKAIFNKKVYTKKHFKNNLVIYFAELIFYIFKITYTLLNLNRSMASKGRIVLIFKKLKRI